MKNKKFIFGTLACSMALALTLPACSDDNDAPEAEQNNVKITFMDIMPYTDREGNVFTAEGDAQGWYGDMKVKFVEGDVVHAQLTFSNDENIYTNAILQKGGKWTIENNREQEEGVKLVRTIFLFDGKKDLYGDAKSLNAAWWACRFSDNYTNPFNYPDGLVQRALVSQGQIFMFDDLSAAIKLQHNNAMIIVDRIDNRTSKDITAITAYNFWGKGNPEDEESQEYYNLHRAGDNGTLWMSTVASGSGNSLDEFKVVLSDNQEIMVPIEKPEWDTSEIESWIPLKETLYYVSITIDSDPSACRATVR